MAANSRLKAAYEDTKACLQQFAELSFRVEARRVTDDDCVIPKVPAPAPKDLDKPPKPINRTLIMAHRQPTV